MAVWQGADPTKDNQLGSKITDPATLKYLSGLDYARAANSGIHTDQMFDALVGAGATQDQLRDFGTMLSTTDLGGQFGKWSNGQVVNDNIQKFLSGARTTKEFTAGPPGHGGWLQHHAGDIFNAVTNPLNAATGGRLGKITGNLGDAIYRNTTLQKGWLGQHVWGQHGALSGVTRSLNNLSVGALTPGSTAPLESALQANYNSDRGRGMSPRQSLGQTGSAAAQIAATAATAGGASPLFAGGIGAAGGAAGAYGQGQNLGGIARGAAIGGVSSAVGSGVGRGVGALAGGGTVGGLAGGTVGGAAGGATRAGLLGEDVGQGAEFGAISGLAGGLGGAAGGSTGSALARLAVSLGLGAAGAGSGGGNVATPTGQPLSTGAGSGGGGGIGDLLSTLAGLGVNLYGANRQGQDASTAANLADPWAPNRGRYVNELNALEANPSSIANLPGYKFGLDQGLGQIGAGNAASGRNLSGGATTDAIKFAEDYASQQFGSEEQRLMLLAGVNSSSPAAAATAWSNMEGQANASRGAVGSSVGSLLQQLLGGSGSSGGSGLLGQLARYFGGGSTPAGGGYDPASGNWGSGDNFGGAGGFDPNTGTWGGGDPGQTYDPSGGEGFGPNYNSADFGGDYADPWAP